MSDQLSPQAIVAEMKNERRSQDVASFGWMPHPEDVRRLGEACAQRDRRHLAAGLDEQDDVSVSVDEPDWEILREACGEVLDREPHIKDVFEEAYRDVIDG